MLVLILLKKKSKTMFSKVQAIWNPKKMLYYSPICFIGSIDSPRRYLILKKMNLYKVLEK